MSILWIESSFLLQICKFPLLKDKQVKLKMTKDVISSLGVKTLRSIYGPSNTRVNVLTLVLLRLYRQKHNW